MSQEISAASGGMESPTTAARLMTPTANEIAVGGFALGPPPRWAFENLTSKLTCYRGPIGGPVDVLEVEGARRACCGDNGTAIAGIGGGNVMLRHRHRRWQAFIPNFLRCAVAVWQAQTQYSCDEQFGLSIQPCAAPKAFLNSHHIDIACFALLLNTRKCPCA